MSNTYMIVVFFITFIYFILNVTLASIDFTSVWELTKTFFIQFFFVLLRAADVMGGHLYNLLLKDKKKGPRTTDKK